MAPPNPPDAAPAPREGPWVALTLLVLGGGFGVAWLPFALGGIPPWHDTLLSARTVQHLATAPTGAHGWTSGVAAWPLPDALTQADWMGLPALLAAPVFGIGGQPLGTYLLVSFLGAALTALAGAALSRALLGPGLHNAVAAVLIGLNPMALAHGSYANLSHGELGLFGLLLTGGGLASRRVAPALLGGLLLGGASHAGFYQGAHAGLLALGLLGAALALRWGDRASWGAAGGGALLGAATVAPVALVYARFEARWDVRSRLDAVAAEAWDLSAPLAFTRGLTPAALQQGATDAPADPVAAAGVALGIALAVLGLAARVRRGGAERTLGLAIAGTGLTAAVLALGPELQWRGEGTGVPMPGRLLVELPGVGGLRAPARWLRVALGATGLLAAAGVQVLSAALPRGRGALGAALALLLTAAFVRPTAAEGPELRRLPKVYRELLQVDGAGPIVDMVAPKGAGGGPGCTCSLTDRVRASLYHRRPLAGGLWARRIDALVQLNGQLRRWPSPDALTLFQAMGVRAVVEHGRQPLVDLPGATCVEVADHRLCTLDPLPEPLPEPCALVDAGDGPFVALRWHTEPDGPIRVQCGDETWTFPKRVWSLLTLLRHGEGGPGLEVVMPTACVEPATVTPPGAFRLAAPDGVGAWPDPVGPGCTLPWSRP